MPRAQQRRDRRSVRADGGGGAAGRAGAGRRRGGRPAWPTRRSRPPDWPRAGRRYAGWTRRRVSQRRRGDLDDARAGRRATSWRGGKRRCCSCRSIRRSIPADGASPARSAASTAWPLTPGGCDRHGCRRPRTPGAPYDGKVTRFNHQIDRSADPSDRSPDHPIKRSQDSSAPPGGAEAPPYAERQTDRSSPLEAARSRGRCRRSDRGGSA